MKYFPEVKEIPKLNRQFIINVLNVTIGESFRSFIHDLIDSRNRLLLLEKQNHIEILPELKNFFVNSSFVSSKFFISNLFKRWDFNFFCFICRFERHIKLFAESGSEKKKDKIGN